MAVSESPTAAVSIEAIKGSLADGGIEASLALIGESGMEATAIYQALGPEIEAAIELVAMLNVFLAVLNLIPLLPFDGGHAHEHPFRLGAHVDQHG